MRLRSHSPRSAAEWGYSYYARCSAELLLREALVLHGRARTLMPRVAHVLASQGSELVSMLPSDVVHWLKLLEDVCGSPYARGVHRDLVSQCDAHNESEHLSIAATIRVVRRVKGQADYRCSCASRNEAPVPDAEASRRVLTLVGRTGAPLAMTPVKDEASPEVARALSEEFHDKSLAHVASLRNTQRHAIACGDCRYRGFAPPHWLAMRWA